MSLRQAASRRVDRVTGQPTEISRQGDFVITSEGKILTIVGTPRNIFGPEEAPSPSEEALAELARRNGKRR